MDFFQFRETLSEAKMSGGIKAELNKLQIWWEEYAGPYGFMDPKDPKKVSLYPIMEPPFDMIRSGGVLVLGYNPGIGEARMKRFRNAVDQVRSRDKAGRLPLVYNKAKGGWFYIIDRKQSGDTEEVGVRKKRYQKRGEDFKRSSFNSKDWLAKSGVNKNMHERGEFGYHRAFNKMLDDIGLSSYRKKTMAANFVPFNSIGVGFPKQKEVERVSSKWVKAFIKSAKPKIIFCPKQTWDLLDTHIGIRKDKESLEIKKEGKNTTFYQAGALPDGTPVVQFTHWANAGVGGPSNPNWNEENVAAIRKDISRMMK